MACESVPEQAVVAAGRGAAVTKVWAEAEVVTVVVEEQAGLQLLAQFWSIHAADAPVHCPCDAQVAHVACESVPEHEVVVVGRRGAAVAMEKVGGAVIGRVAAVAAVVAEQQLLAQFAAIHAADVLVHSPCDAQVAHVACILEATFWRRSTSGLVLVITHMPQSIAATRQRGTDRCAGARTCVSVPEQADVVVGVVGREAGDGGGGTTEYVDDADPAVFEHPCAAGLASHGSCAVPTFDPVASKQGHQFRYETVPLDDFGQVEPVWTEYELGELEHPE